MIHIKDIEKAFELLKKWDDVSSRLNNDGIVMVKEMARLSIQTRRLLGGIDDEEKNLG